MSGARALLRKRARLLLVIAVFAAPLVLAYALYYSGWRPEGGRAHGELVTPPRPVTDVEVTPLDAAAVRFSSFQRQWLMLYFGSSDCQAVCERALYHMRQVIAAQGRQAHRVRAAMLVTDDSALIALRDQLRNYPGLVALTATPDNLARLAREFELPAGGALSGLHRIYVIDPLGNFMMSYPAGVDPAGMRKDLERLLRYSQVG